MSGLHDPVPGPPPQKKKPCVTLACLVGRATYIVMVSKLDQQTFTSEFKSHLVPLSYVFVPHLSKKLCKLLNSSPGFVWKNIS